MKPIELGRIAFGAIGTEDTSTWDACSANVSTKTYVGLDMNYTRSIENQMDFSIMVGLQFHKYSLNVMNAISLRKQDNIDMKEAGIEQDKIFKHSKELFDIANDSNQKYLIVLFLMNSLCDQYGINKTASLAFAEIKISTKDLEAYEIPDREFWSDSAKKYHDDIRYVLETTINLGIS